MRPIYKLINIDITSTPFSILTNEIYDVKEDLLIGRWIDVENEWFFSKEDFEETLREHHSRFSEFMFESYVEDKELGFIEAVWKNEEEFIKITIYLEDE